MKITAGHQGSFSRQIGIAHFNPWMKCSPSATSYAIFFPLRASASRLRRALQEIQRMATHLKAALCISEQPMTPMTQIKITTLDKY